MVPVDEAFMKKGDDDDEEESEATLGLEQKGEKLHCEELKFDFCLMLNYMHIFYSTWQRCQPHTQYR